MSSPNKVILCTVKLLEYESEGKIYGRHQLKAT